MIDLAVVNFRTHGDLTDFCAVLRTEPPSVPWTLTIVNVCPRREDDWVADHWFQVLPTALRPPIWVKMLSFEDNVGYARACNAASQLGAEKYLAFFNADTRVPGYSIDQCVGALEENPNWAVLGPRQVDDNGRLTHAGIFGEQRRPLHRAWLTGDNSEFQDVRTDPVTVSGAAYFMRRAVWDELSHCPHYRMVAPDAEGAFLPTPHYYEETYCLAGDSMIWTVGGPVPLADLQVGTEVYGYDEATHRLRRSNVSWVGKTGHRRVCEVAAEGRTVRATAEHRVLVIEGVGLNGSGGSVSWKRVDELSSGDRLVGARDLPVSRLDDRVDPRMALFIGQYLGNGVMDKRSVTIALPPDSRVRAVYEMIAQECFAKRSRWSRVERDEPWETGPITIQAIPRAFRFASVDAVDQLRTLGCGGTASEKRIPDWVFHSSLEIRLMVLAGLVDSDGSVNEAGQLLFSSSSQLLAEGVRQLLVSCGLPVGKLEYAEGRDVEIVGRLTKGRGVWTALCSQPARIPFLDPLYRQRVERFPNRRARPHVMGVAHAGLEPNEVTSRRVLSLVDLGEQPVWDLTVDGLHSVVSDGVVVHNCSYHARAHGWQLVYYGPARVVHRWHKASPVGGWADQQFTRSREIFRAACEAHGIAHD